MISLRGLGAAANVTAIANAIAYAEGYYAPGQPGVVNSPSVAPVRNNNPCDLFSGGSLASYSTIDAGWSACDNQINLMLDGGSSYYTPDESISQIAATYAPASAGNVPSNWANIVASQLGLSPSQPLTAVSGSSVAQTSTDPTTGLETPITSTDTGDDSGLDSTGDSSLFDLNDLSLTDDSGNLTGFGWGLVAVGVGLAVWVAAS